MSRQSRRTWFAVAVVMLVGLALAASFLGDGLASAARQLHGHP